MADDNKQSSDHDLLITLNVRVQDLIETIKSMDGTISRDIGGLKEGKLDKSIYTAHCSEDAKDFQYTKEKLEEHDRELKRLSWLMGIGIGVIAVIQFITPFILKKFI
jgi:hypothetical protein